MVSLGTCQLPPERDKTEMQKLLGRYPRVGAFPARALTGESRADHRLRGRSRIGCRGSDGESDAASEKDLRPGSVSSGDLFSHSGHSIPGVVCYRKPSLFLPPTRAIEAQMNALQSNDWPEDCAGVEAAFQFTWPNNAEQILPGEVNLSLRKAWSSSSWCTLKEFREQMASAPYCFLLHCESWEVLSDLRFTDEEGLNAYQTVKVNAAAKSKLTSTRSHHFYTFHMKQIGSGALKGFWMTDEVSIARCSFNLEP